jgi:hypothetical protein
MQPALAGEHEQRGHDDQAYPHNRRYCRSHQAAQCHRQRADRQTSDEQPDGEVGP